MPYPSWFLTSALALMMNASTAPDSSIQAQGHFARGMSYFHRGSYDQAAQALESAYALSPDPLILLNLGRVHQRAGRLAEARRLYHRCLAAKPPDALAKIAQRYLAEVDAPTPLFLQGPLLTPHQERASPHQERVWLWVSMTVLGVGVLGVGIGLGSYYGTVHQMPR